MDLFFCFFSKEKYSIGTVVFFLRIRHRYLMYFVSTDHYMMTARSNFNPTGILPLCILKLQT